MLRRNQKPRIVKKNKKAQINQVFTYLVIILVVGLIVVFGYKGISAILKTKCEQQSIDFERNIMGFIDEYSGGSVYEEVISVPCNTREVCLADADFCISETPPTFTDQIRDDLVIKNNLEDCQANVFVIGEFTEPVGYSEKLALSREGGDEQDYPFVCFKPRNDKLKLRFAGQGRRTLVASVWNE